jgi:hypothetical protein
MRQWVDARRGQLRCLLSRVEQMAARATQSLSRRCAGEEVEVPTKESRIETTTPQRIREGGWGAYCAQLSSEPTRLIFLAGGVNSLDVACSMVNLMDDKDKFIAFLLCPYSKKKKKGAGMVEFFLQMKSR